MRLWLANLISATGTMVQGVGAAWLMTTLAGTPDAAAEREIEQLEAEYGDRLPKVMFIMTLARPEDRDR